MENKNISEEGHKEQKKEIPILVKIKPNVTALILSLVSLLLSGYAIFRTVGKEKIEIRPHDYLGLLLSDEKIAISPYISFKNYGKSTGSISSLEAFIMSTSTDSRIPKYMRHFSNAGHYDTDNNWRPFLGYFIYPNESFDLDFSLFQKKSDGYGSFESGVYEYLVTLTDDKGKTVSNLCYEFQIDNYQVKSILGGKTEYVQLVPLQEDRIKELLSTFKSFKETPKGNDINDLQSGITFTVTFDPNGGTGGKSSQIFLAGRGKPLDGGIPIRSGYKFSYWSEKPDNYNNKKNKKYYNGVNTNVGGDNTLYAIWESD